MIYSYKNSHTLQPIRICNGSVECVKSFRYLGLILDNNLCFGDHIEAVSHRVSRSIGVMARVSSFMPVDVNKSIYYSIVHPHLVYGIEAWYGASKYLRDRLFTLQKRVVRTILGAPYLAHTDPIFDQLGLLKVSQLYTYNLACYVFKCINISGFDRLLHAYIVAHCNEHNHRTRNRNLITLPFVL